MDNPTYNDDEARLITGLVDESTAGADRADADRLAGRRPEIGPEVAAQRRAVAELQRGGPPVPDRLVASVTQRVQDRYGTPAPPATAARRRWRPAITAPALALALAAVVVALVLVLSGGSSGSGPSITRAAQLAYAPPTRPAPAARDARFLDVSYGGVTFPNYQRAFGAPPSGERLDRLGGRPALTVFYRLRGGATLSYTVFSGRAVPRPGTARAVVYQGIHLHVFTTRSGLAVVTLVRHGRTCVLAAPTPRDIVLALAAEPVLVTA
jgi:hypothetical protein